MAILNFALGLLLLTFSGCSHTAPSVATDGALVIKDVTVISPERDLPLEHASVWIRDGRILEISSDSEKTPIAGARVISGVGKFVIPGLLDAHVHLASIPGVGLDNPPKDTRIATEYFKQLPRSYLYFGYTTLVDLAAARPQVLVDFRKEPLHPDLYDCGPSLPIANGYPMGFVPQNVRYKLFTNFIYDPAQASTIPPEYAVGHTPAAAIARVKASGGVCIKTYWEKGFGKNMHFPVFADEVLKEIAHEAKKSGLVSLVHANSLEAQEHVVSTGLNIIAHGMWNWGDLGKEAGIPKRVKRVLDQVISRKLGYMPTIQVIGGTQALADPAFLDDPNLARVLPRGMVDYYRSDEGKWFKNMIEKDEGVTLSMQSNEPHLSRVGRVTRYLAERNANLVFGTDTPSAPTYGNPPGYNGFLEMKRWISNGVTLKQLLRSATLGAAQAMKLDNSVGSLESGKAANLLLLSKNPLETIEAYDSIETVVIRGVPIQRSDLRASE